LSVLIVPVGDAFLPGVKASYDLACEHYKGATGEKAAVCRGEQMCLIPYFGLNSVKNYWACKASLEGWTHCLFVDNDILLEGEDFLLKLVSSQKPYIVPYHDAEWRDGPNTWAIPAFGKNTGLHELEWAAVSCVMVELALIQQIGPTIFSEAFIHHEDEYTCLRLRAQGISIWQNSDTTAGILRASGIGALIERYKKL
jgi:hypothetical protein